VCGIVGIAQEAGTRVDREILVRMRDSMRHRGPDGAGLELDDGIGLGHRRLAILDLSEAGRQPMSNEDGSVWLVANGEIFNYVELGRELREKGHQLRSACDSEVILHLYEDHGVECVRFLNGMFAFALWDRRRRRLFAARDRMGVKPFYFHQRPRGIAFASEIKALLEDPSVPRRPDPRGIADFLFCGQPLGGKTLFEGISELRPGHALLFEEGRTRIWPYWRPDYHKIDRPDAQVLDEIGALLHDSVRMRVRSDVALGSQLSGGIDSGVITALTNHFQPGSKTFTIRSGAEGYYDETPQARRVARHLGTLHHESMVESADLDRDLTRLAWHMDMPMPTPGGFNYHAVARLEAEHVKVVMTGHGGDELFAGYPAQFQACFGHQSMFDHRRTPPPPRTPSPAYRLRRVIQRLGSRGVMDRIWRRLAPPREGLEEEWVRLHCSPLEADPDLHPGFIESLAGYSPVDEYLDQFRNGGATEPLDRCLNHDLRCYLPSLLFMEDRASMAVSIESRTPLLDYRIADYLARLPVEQRVRGLVPKWLLREVGRPLLPDEIVDRRDKIPFPLPLLEWLAGDLAEPVQRILGSPAARSREIFVTHALTERGFHAGHDWSVLSLELWFRIFFDGKLEPGTPLREIDG
jgi:asparagine synthase (glutamine-hydrolysing)